VRRLSEIRCDFHLQSRLRFFRSRSSRLPKTTYRPSERRPRAICLGRGQSLRRCVLDHSRAGNRRCNPQDEGAAGELLNFTTTIVNNTDSDLSVHHGGARVDGHTAFPLPVVVTNKGLNKRDRKQVWELWKMSCFSSGFLSNEKFLSPSASSRVFTVAPKTALTVSFVARDPRSYPFLCSVEGCYPTGTSRFYVTVNTTDYVFVWTGRSSVIVVSR